MIPMAGPVAGGQGCGVGFVRQGLTCKPAAAIAADPADMVDSAEALEGSADGGCCCPPPTARREACGVSPGVCPPSWPAAAAAASACCRSRRVNSCSQLASSAFLESPAHVAKTYTPRTRGFTQQRAMPSEAYAPFTPVPGPFPVPWSTEGPEQQQSPGHGNSPKALYTSASAAHGSSESDPTTSRSRCAAASAASR